MIVNNLENFRRQNFNLSRKFSLLAKEAYYLLANFNTGKHDENSLKNTIENLHLEGKAINVLVQKTQLKVGEQWEKR